MSKTPEKPRPFPTYRLHTASGKAITTLTETGRRRDYILGSYGSPESHEEYDRVIGRWLLNGRRFSDAKPVMTDETTIHEVLAKYREHIAELYPPPSRQLEALKHNTRILAEFCGDLPAAHFDTDRLDELRRRMIAGGTYPATSPSCEGEPFAPLCRKTVNVRVQHICRVFKWAESKKLVPSGVWHHLRTLSALRPGQYGAKESDGVDEVPDQVVEATKPYLSRTVRAMVELQRLTGARPGEITAMRACDIDRTGDVWVYRPATHKNRWRGKSRTILIGPKAQLALRPFIGDDPGAFLFSPGTALAERQSVVKSTVGGRPVRGRYSRYSYARAVQRACDRANREALKKAIDDAERAGMNPPPAGVRLVPRWSPNQLRHTAATMAEQTHGIEGAAALLGHARIDTTRLYAKKNEALALKVVTSAG